MNDIGIDAAHTSQDTQQQQPHKQGTPNPSQENTAMAVPEPRALRTMPGAELVPTRGAQTGARIAVASILTIGRARDCDVFLDDVTISRHHAELHHEGHDHYTLVDTGSLNGIYLNRHPMTQRTKLADGDEIWIGKARFTFHITRTIPNSGETTSP